MPGHVDPMLFVMAGLALVWGFSSLPLRDWFDLVARHSADVQTAFVAVHRRPVAKTAALVVIAGCFVFLPSVRAAFPHLFFLSPLLFPSLDVASLAWEVADPRDGLAIVARRPYPHDVFARRLLVTLVFAALFVLVAVAWVPRAQAGSVADAAGALCFVVVAAGALWLSQFSPANVALPRVDAPVYAVADARKLAQSVALVVGLFGATLVLSRFFPASAVAFTAFASILTNTILPGTRAALRDEGRLGSR